MAVNVNEVQTIRTTEIKLKTLYLKRQQLCNEWNNAFDYAEKYNKDMTQKVRNVTSDIKKTVMALDNCIQTLIGFKQNGTALTLAEEVCRFEIKRKQYIYDNKDDWKHKMIADPIRYKWVHPDNTLSCNPNEIDSYLTSLARGKDKYEKWLGQIKEIKNNKN